MPSRRVTWIVLAIAIGQGLLGGAVLVTRDSAIRSFNEGREVADDLSASPRGGTDPTPRSGSETPDTPPEEPSPRASNEEEAAKPPLAGSPGSAPLKLHGTYAQLKPDEQRMVASDPPYKPMLEGRLLDAVVWRLSAHREPPGQVCFERTQWDAEKKSGGSGRGATGADCRSTEEWDWGMAAHGEKGNRYVGINGFAPGEAHEIELVTKDGRRGRVGGVFNSEMGVSFFMAWMRCDDPDLDRFHALDRDGKVLSTYDLKPLGQGMPSWFCEFLDETG